MAVSLFHAYDHSFRVLAQELDRKSALPLALSSGPRQAPNPAAAAVFANAENYSFLHGLYCN
jgi:hypothetical protein